MKISEYISKFLVAKDINTVFELQGGMITRIIDSLNKEKDLKIVSMHHEQAAAMAADSFARITNKPGVALATSGPGATNLLTGIGNCFFDSVPAIFITGQVNLAEQKGNLKTRQIGFQETDIVSMAKPITKAAYAIKNSDEVPEIFEKAYELAVSGRPGPVLIDIPMDIQNHEISILDIKSYSKRKSNTASIIPYVKEFASDLKASKRPLILVGRGIRASDSVKKFDSFLNKISIPVVCSLLGIDVLPYDHKNRVGFIGTYGNRWANYALGQSDLLLVLGSRMDLRQTGADVDSFMKGKHIYHIDIDGAELNNRIKGSKTLVADLSDFLDIAYAHSESHKTPDIWLNDINKMRSAWDDNLELKKASGINPNTFLHQLSRTSVKASAFSTDVGSNQMWCAQSIELRNGQYFLSSGGMGAMGYSLPAAIGASIALGGRPVVAIAGDGGFQINIQELQTIVRNNLPLKIVILNNHCLGMIRQFQDSYFDSCYQSTVWGYSTPSFCNIANGYEIDSFHVDSPSTIDEGLDRLWHDPMKPFLLEVDLDVHTNVYPKMMFGKGLTEMEGDFF